VSNEPDQFEAGEDVTESFERSRHSGMVVSVRLPAEDSDKLIDLAEETGRTVSQVARQAIRSFLAGGGRKVDNQEVSATMQAEAPLVVRSNDQGSPTEGSAARTWFDQNYRNVALTQLVAY
jgi:hypothetical protein